MNRKSLAVLLSLVMLLAMASGAWALRTTTLTASGAGVVETATEDIDTSPKSGAAGRGAYAINGGKVVIPNFNITISADAATYAAYASTNGQIDMSGDIDASGPGVYGVLVMTDSSMDLRGVVTVSGDLSRGLGVAVRSKMTVVGPVTTTGENVVAAHAREYSSLDITGNITVSAITGGGGAHAYDSSDVIIRGNVSVDGFGAYGVKASLGGTLNMESGTLTVDASSYGVVLETNGIVNLDGVVADAAQVVSTATTGTLNAYNGSLLTGDVLHEGVGNLATTLFVNLTDSALDGALLVRSNVGAMSPGEIALTLNNSEWNVTGDTYNPTGTVTGNADSKINYNSAPDATTVVIGMLTGDATIDVKPGDYLIIKNPDDLMIDIASSDPDVVEVTKNADGSFELAAKGDGPATITYSYMENGATVSKTIEVTSGSGNKPTGNGGGGGSSNCNAGFGATALLSLLGLALVLKRK